jgi:hypothetical protein
MGTRVVKPKHYRKQAHAVALDSTPLGQCARAPSCAPNHVEPVSQDQNFGLQRPLRAREGERRGDG